MEVSGFAAPRCLLRAANISVQPSTNILFAVLPIHLFEKSGTFELVDKARSTNPSGLVLGSSEPVRDSK
jgi:hypothetical protein